MMPKSFKKELRKTKDKIIHCANDVYEKAQDEKVPSEQKEKLEAARDSLIEATNQLTEVLHS